EDAALLHLVIEACAVQLLLHQGRNDGQRDQLRVWMFERSAGGLAIILEQDDAAEALVLLQIIDALLEGPEHFSDLARGHLGERLLVLARLDDDFVRTNAAHLVVHSFAGAVETPFNAEHGKLVGNDTDTPARLVAAAVRAVSQHLRRSLLLVAVIE